MGGTPSFDPKQVRVGHAEREATVQRLSRAHALGQLTLDEFDSRTQLAYDATVRGDLDALVADLPPEPGTIRPEPQAPSATGGGLGAKSVELQHRAKSMWERGGASRAKVVFAVIGTLWLIGILSGPALGIVGDVIGSLFSLAIVVGVIMWLTNRRR